MTVADALPSKAMYITIIRYSTTDESTLGVMLINGEFACYTLEDPYNFPKVENCTRIPGGIYRLDLYRAGRLHDTYQENYPGIHHGMIHVQDVPGFTGVLMHIGNRAMNTAGCILWGDKVNNNQLQGGYIENSASAYIRVYPRIARGILEDETTKLLIGTPRELIQFNPFNERGDTNG